MYCLYDSLISLRYVMSTKYGENLFQKIRRSENFRPMRCRTEKNSSLLTCFCTIPGTLCLCWLIAKATNRFTSKIKMKFRRFLAESNVFRKVLFVHKFTCISTTLKEPLLDALAPNCPMFGAR